MYATVWAFAVAFVFGDQGKKKGFTGIVAIQKQIISNFFWDESRKNCTACEISIAPGREKAGRTAASGESERERERDAGSWGVRNKVRERIDRSVELGVAKQKRLGLSDEGLTRVEGDAGESSSSSSRS